MGYIKKQPKPSIERKEAKARTPQARENQMINYAEELAEKQLIAGTASSQVIVHYLKLATRREELERERLVKENELLAAKTKSLESLDKIEELYTMAIQAMSRYNGEEDESHS